MAKTEKVTRRTHTDRDTDGATDEIQETVTVTDRRENVLSVEDKVDYEADGVFDTWSLITNEYDKRGHQTLNKYEFDYEYDGKLDQVWEIRSTWKKDLLISEVLTSDQGVDGVDYTSTTSLTYDRYGNLTERLVAEDWGADGVPDNTDRYTSTYENKQLVRQIGDYGDNGSIDFESDFTYQTDKGTKTTTRFTNIDYDGDGVRDTNFLVATVTDKRGNVLSINDKTDNDLDGFWDDTSIWTNEYDRRGHLTLHRYDSYGGDETIDYSVQTEYTWNRDLLISEVETSDRGDGVPDHVFSTFNTYNRHGNLTEMLRTFDSEGDGIINSTDRYTYIYDNEDQLVQEIGNYADDGIIDYFSNYYYA